MEFVQLDSDSPLRVAECCFTLALDKRMQTVIRASCCSCVFAVNRLHITCFRSSEKAIVRLMGLVNGEYLTLVSRRTETG